MDVMDATWHVMDEYSPRPLCNQAGHNHSCSNTAATGCPEVVHGCVRLEAMEWHVSRRDVNEFTKTRTPCNFHKAYLLPSD